MTSPGEIQASKMIYWSILGILTALKTLLIPSYRSTDFEVHRNWLAITHSLPVNKWYHEDTSEWTLDYPPLFAWFECLLSQLAKVIDPQMLVVSNLNYASTATIVFQRLTVVTTDLVYIYAVKEFCTHCMRWHSKSSDWYKSPKLTLFLLLSANCGLLLVDHIHFQYNGFLFGLMLLSLVRMSQGRNLEGAFWFSCLLNFKHIYLYVAPAYFVHLLRNYCFSSNKDGSLRWRSFSPSRFLSLGFIVISVFALSLGPFVLMDQVQQLAARLFPFKRGLCHAYWAPNFWALYNILDKAIAVTGVKAGWLPGNVSQQASMTGGLVQEFQHAVLPSITPIATLACTAISILPATINLWLYPSGHRGFLRCLVLCAFGSFMFGWHVHEKAVLIMIIPLTLLAFEKKKDAQVYLMLSTVGHFSLFPLIFTQAETPIKYCLMICFTIYAFLILGRYYEDPGSFCRLPLLSRLETLYLLGLVPLELYCSGVHSLLGLSHTLPFLPLLLTSVYCSLGVSYSWLRLYWLTLTDPSSSRVSKEA